MHARTTVTPWPPAAALRTPMLRTPRDPGCAAVLLAAAAEGSGDGGAGFDAWCAAHAGCRAQVWLAADGTGRRARLPLPALRAIAERHRVTLALVRPWWCAALRQAAVMEPALQDAGSSRLLVVEGRAVTDVRLCAGRMRMVRRHRLPRAEAAALGDLLPDAAERCVAIGYGLSGAPPAQLRVVGSLAAPPVLSIDHRSTGVLGSPRAAAT